MGKITYEDKVTFKVSNLQPKNKVTASDMNEIKESVNALYDLNPTEYEFIHDFVSKPLSGGTLSRNIATTLPLGTIIKEVNFKILTSITATPTSSEPVKLQIGIEDDDESLSMLPILTSGIQHVYSVTTTLINRNLKITAIDGTITGGSISIIITKR